MSAALFTQLQPGSAAHALSGVPGLEPEGMANPTSTPVVADPEIETLQPPLQESRPVTVPMPVVSVPLVPTISADDVPEIQVLEPSVVEPSVSPIPVPVASIAVPTISLMEMPVPVTTDDVEVDPEPEHDSPKPDPRSLLMLDEISFLDEDS